VMLIAIITCLFLLTALSGLDEHECRGISLHALSSSFQSLASSSMSVVCEGVSMVPYLAHAS
jgi:hypothetical protein